MHQKSAHLRQVVLLGSALAALACGGSREPTTGTGGAGTPPPAERVPLRKVAESRGLHIGVGAAVGSLFGRTDAAATQYTALLAKEFNVITPENDMKFQPLRPSRGEFRFARADSMVEFAAANGMKVRGHTLVWHSQLAPWLTSGNWTAAEAKALLDEHVSTVAGHYKGKLAAWDVVNEALADDGSPRSTFWSTHVGPDYIAQAFTTAHAADPDVALFYNDYGIEWPGAKQDAAYALLADVRSRGVPVHGVGFQMHLALGQAPSKQSLLQTFERFAALGLKIEVTELDVRVQLPSTAQSLQAQAQIYRDVYDACLQTPACDMVVTWGFTDLLSWVPSTFPNWGDALLFDASFQPKPAYWSVHDLLEGK